MLGLGLAFALAYLVSAAWALQVLSYKVPGFALRPIFASLGRMLLASLLMAEVVWLVGRAVGGNSGVGAVVRVVAGTRRRRRGVRRRAGAAPGARARRRCEAVAGVAP